MPTKKQTDLIDEMDKAAEETKEQEHHDLLDEMDGSSARVWRPDLNEDGREENHPIKLQGVVTAVGEAPIGYEGAVIPWVEIDTNIDRPDLGFAKGERWAIRGYGNVLIAEMLKSAPQKDMIVVTGYFGKKTPKEPGKDGKPKKAYHHYQFRAVWPDGQAPVAPAAGSTKSPF